MRSIRALLSWCATLWESAADPAEEDETAVGRVDFRRSLQTDDYSCGARAVFMISNHFGLGVSYQKVKTAVRTTAGDGTPVVPMIRFLRERGLKVNHCPSMNVRSLRRALQRDAVVLVHLDGDHFGVVHAMSLEYVYLADPSIFRQRGPRISKVAFAGRWSRWGITVRSTDRE
jgi:ABC-type bacteriocin/lantibiotic exporter with double-glycine peptidase domain